MRLNTVLLCIALFAIGMMVFVPLLLGAIIQIRGYTDPADDSYSTNATIELMKVMGTANPDYCVHPVRLWHFADGLQWDIDNGFRITEITLERDVLLKVRLHNPTTDERRNFASPVLVDCDIEPMEFSL